MKAGLGIVIAVATFVVAAASASAAAPGWQIGAAKVDTTPPAFDAAQDLQDFPEVDPARGIDLPAQHLQRAAPVALRGALPGHRRVGRLLLPGQRRSGRAGARAVLRLQPQRPLGRHLPLRRRRPPRQDRARPDRRPRRRRSRTARRPSCSSPSSRRGSSRTTSARRARRRRRSPGRRRTRRAAATSTRWSSAPTTTRARPTRSASTARRRTRPGASGSTRAIDEYYMDWLDEQMANAAVDACDNRRPASLREVEFPVPPGPRAGDPRTGSRPPTTSAARRRSTPRCACCRRATRAATRSSR